MKRIAVVALFLALFLIVVPTNADEGMWLLNNLPLEQLRNKYNFVPTPEWVEHVQKSSARLPNCSSSFVSSDGLVFTNGHCAEEAVQALSTPQNNLYEKGFYARTYKEELKTDRNLRVLMSMKDVTDAINKLVATGATGSRQQVIQHIQKVYSDQYNLTCEIAALYQGGQYHNYCYRVYDDVRLVFSTEKNVWFMGGDADNFEYPRYTMDVAFFRAYENGKPAKTPFRFKWSKSGAKEGELIFVSGHPGNTKRLLTSAALKTERDVRVPFLLDLFRRRELTLQQFMLRGKEQRRVAESDLSSWQNSRKLYVGKIRGLQDPRLMESKKSFEAKVYRDFATNASVANKIADGLLMVQDAQMVIRKNYMQGMLLNRGLGFDSVLFGYAQSIISGNQKMAQTALVARTNEPPLNLEYEEAKLKDSLTHFTEVFGADSLTVNNMMRLTGNGPADIAHKLVYSSKLSDINEHRQMVETVGTGNLKNSNDPIILLAVFVREESKIFQGELENVAEKEKQGHAQLTSALLQGYGAAGYPDATFTLRLSFGTISSYFENGTRIPPFTTIGGVYRHSAEFDNKDYHKLPSRWFLRKSSVNLKTRLNFVSNLDITGGNSGSPVFNRNREIVGIVFDSNIEGLVSDYDFNYTPSARAIAVHSAGILEILKKIYRADRLVAELTR